MSPFLCVISCFRREVGDDCAFKSLA